MVKCVFELTAHRQARCRIARRRRALSRSPAVPHQPVLNRKSPSESSHCGPSNHGSRDSARGSNRVIHSAGHDGTTVSDQPHDWTSDPISRRGSTPCSRSVASLIEPSRLARRRPSGVTARGTWPNAGASSRGPGKAESAAACWARGRRRGSPGSRPSRHRPRPPQAGTTGPARSARRRNHRPAGRAPSRPGRGKGRSSRQVPPAPGTARRTADRPGRGRRRRRDRRRFRDRLALRPRRAGRWRLVRSRPACRCRDRPARRP